MSRRTRNRLRLGLRVPSRTDCPSQSQAGTGCFLQWRPVRLSESGRQPAVLSLLRVAAVEVSCASTCTVCLVRMVVCLSTTTSGDLNNSILQGPQFFFNLQNFWRMGDLNQNSQTSCPSYPESSSIATLLSGAPVMTFSICPGGGWAVYYIGHKFRTPYTT